jgi:hypothetical protein
VLSRLSGLRDPSMPLSVPSSRSFEVDSTLRFPHRRPSHGLSTADILSQALAPFQSFTRTSPQNSGCSLRLTPLLYPFRGFFPFSVCVTRSHISPPVPIPPVRLRPQGFSPPRRFAPLMTSRACSIPVPLMGFFPSRLLSSPGAVRPLGRRAPRGFLSTQKRRDRPSRDSHTARSPATGPGVTPSSCAACLLGLSRSEVSCSGQRRTLTRPFVPSRAFSDRSHADLTAGAPGYLPPRTQPFSLEIG